MSNKREFRFVAAHELRVQQTEKGKQISGYAAVYNSTSCDLGGFTEVISPGAFDRCLSTSPDVACLHEHDRRQGLLGRTASGTLQLSTDNVGLFFTCDLPNTTLGNDVAESISRRDLSGCSFGFVCNNDHWIPTQDGLMLRTLLDVELFEVTMTSCPAYEATSVSLRSKMFPEGQPEPKVEQRDKTEERSASCQCECDPCQTNNCLDCDDDACSDPECGCSEGRTNKLLAAVLQRRTR